MSHLHVPWDPPASPWVLPNPRVLEDLGFRSLMCAGLPLCCSSPMVGAKTSVWVWQD